MIDFSQLPRPVGIELPGQITIPARDGEVPLISRAYLEARAKEQIDFFVINVGQNFVHPFYQHIDGMPICIGTCFGAVYNGIHFIVTAAHVIDNINFNLTNTYSFGRASCFTVPPHVHTFYEGKWLDDDIALMQCEKEDYPTIHFIPLERSTFSYAEKFFYPLGFPSYANTPNLDKETNLMTGACIGGTLDSRHLTAELIAKLRPNGIITPFKKLDVHPGGFSGGVLFTVDWETELPPFPKFEGMLTTCEEADGFSGVCVSRIIDAIEQHLGHNDDEEHFSTQSII